MCTAVNLTTRDHYFGRNLDLEYHYDEQVVILPRRYPLVFRNAQPLQSHAALIGMATIADGYPLFYDATNEHGVSMAGLSFPGNAHYFPLAEGSDNITPFEFIPWVLGQCRNMREVRALFERISLLNENFSARLPLSPLHWMVSWKDESLVVESTQSGLHIYKNPVGVATNNPTFDMQMLYLSSFMRLSPEQPENTLAPEMELRPYSNGMGALGLPGDLSSPSRFVRAAYTKLHSLCGDSERESVSQFFHILGAVSHPRGSVLVHGRPEITVYASCCNADRGVYYYKTYENSQITGVDMHRVNLCGEQLFCYPLITKQQIAMQN